MAKKGNTSINNNEAIQRVTIFNPNQEVIRGMISYLTPQALLPGYFNQLTNVRFPSRNLVVRDGITKLSPTVPFLGTGQYEGSFSAIMNGQPSIFCAIGLLNTTYCYSINPVTFSYTEITGVSTHYGNTRMQIAPVSFAVIRDPSTNQDLLEMQNGLDYPRIWDGNNTAIHQPINVPASPGFAVTFTFASSTNIVGFSTSSSRSVGITSYTGVDSVDVKITVGSGITGTLAPNGYVVVVDAGGKFPNDQSMDGTRLITTVNSSSQVTVSALSTTYVPTGSPLYLSPSIGVSAMYNTVTTILTPAVLVTPYVLSGEFTVVKLINPITFLNTDNLVIAFSPGGGGPNNSNISIASNLQISISNATTGATVVFDPSVPSYIQPAYVTGIDNTNPYSYIASYSLSSLSPSDPNLSCVYLKFAWIGSAPVTPLAIYIGGVYQSNGIYGGASYSLAWYNSASRAESAGYIPVVATTVSGGLLNGLQFQNASIPNSAVLQFSSLISAINVGTSEIQRGTDTLNIYRLDNGGVQYNYIEGYKVNSYSGNAWIISNANQVFTVRDTVPVINENVARIAPDSYSLPIPVGTQVLAANGRILVGGVGSTSQNYVYISEYYNHCRYRSQVRFLSPGNPDQSSATIVQFPGEQFVSMTLGGASLIGVAPIVVFTTANIWLLTSTSIQMLSRPSNLGYNGGPYFRAHCSYLGNVYFIDDENQVRIVGSSGLSAPISKLRVDDKLQSGNLAYASMAVNNDRLYIAYTPKFKASNTNVLFYELTPGLQMWGEDIPSNGASVADFLQISHGSKRLLYYFDDHGSLYQYESGSSDDAGTAINVNIQSGSFHNEMWSRIYCENVGIVMDPIPSPVTVTRTWKDKEYGFDGIINIGQEVRDTAWMWEMTGGIGNTANIKPGGIGLAVMIGLGFTAPAGTQVYSLVVNMKGMAESGAVYSGT